MIKKDNPKIGQATVYINLKTMANDGYIIIIPGKNNTNRYDGDKISYMNILLDCRVWKD